MMNDWDDDTDALIPPPPPRPGTRETLDTDDDDYVAAYNYALAQLHEAVLERERAAGPPWPIVNEYQRNGALCDALANTWVEGIDEAAWVAAALRVLGYEK